MGPTALSFATLCLCLIVFTGSADSCSSESPDSCANTDQTELLQRHVGIADTMGVMNETDEDTDDKPNVEDTNIECGNFITEARCHNGGCTWKGDTCELLDEENPDDTNIGCPSFQTQHHCVASGCAWSGDTCVEDVKGSETGSGSLLQDEDEDEDGEDEEDQDQSLSQTEDEAQTSSKGKDADTSDQVATRGCRRRRYHRRRWPCCRRRRAPTIKKAPKDGYHQECWTAGGCKDDGKKMCAWCGQHVGQLMYCCSAGGKYAQGHACYKSKFSSSVKGHHCVTPAEGSAAAYKWLDLSGARATQSSNNYGNAGHAKLAIDGSSSVAWPYKSCTHTRNDNNAWWQVDLGKTTKVTAIAITNRGDCCGSRLSPFSVLVGTHKCASAVSIAQGETKLVPCKGVGSTVRVQMAKRTYLTICEFRVATEAVKPSPAPPPPTKPSPAPPSPAPGSQSPATNSQKQTNSSKNTVFDRIDVDNSQTITRDEFRKAFKVFDRAPSPPAPGRPSPSPAPATSTLPTQAQKDAIVAKHNGLRASVGASDMTMMVWDSALAAAAQKWVSGCPSGHSKNRNNAGENIAWRWATNLKPTAQTNYDASIQSWFDEVGKSGPYKSGGTFQGFGQCSGTCGHYTQVVWATANKIGCGVAYCPHSSGMGGYELVCQYGSSVSGGTGGNMRGSTLFTKGTACSKCPGGFRTCKNGLCATGA